MYIYIYICVCIYECIYMYIYTYEQIRGPGAVPVIAVRSFPDAAPAFPSALCALQCV